MHIKKNTKCCYIFLLSILLYGCDNTVLSKILSPAEIEFPKASIYFTKNAYKNSYILYDTAVKFSLRFSKNGNYKIQVVDDKGELVSGDQKWLPFQANKTIKCIVYSQAHAYKEKYYFSEKGFCTLKILFIDKDDIYTESVFDYTIVPLNALLVTGSGTSADGIYNKLSKPTTFTHNKITYTSQYQKDTNIDYKISLGESAVTLTRLYIHSGEKDTTFQDYYRINYEWLDPLVVDKITPGSKGSSQAPDVVQSLPKITQ